MLLCYMSLIVLLTYVIHRTVHDFISFSLFIFTYSVQTGANGSKAKSHPAASHGYLKLRNVANNSEEVQNHEKTHVTNGCELSPPELS